MRKSTKKVFLTTMLFGTTLFLGFPSMNLAHANGNPVVAEANANEETDEAEQTTEQTAEETTQQTTEQTGDVAEPPSGPDVNRDEVTETVDIETPASVTGQRVDGTGTVTDFTTSGSKAFYTIRDSEQNVFYLIIDLDKTENNVYFLSDINKSDLAGTTEGAAQGTAQGTAQQTTNMQAPTEQVESATAVAPKEENSGNGFLIAVLLIAVVGVAAYYFLVMRKRHKRGKEEDENDEMIEDYEDDFYEDEQENKDNK